MGEEGGPSAHGGDLTLLRAQANIKQKSRTKAKEQKFSPQIK